MPETASTRPAREVGSLDGCCCLGGPLDARAEHGDGIPPDERPMLEEIALVMTEERHGACGLSAEGLAGLSDALARLARGAYIEARLNGLCVDGATEVYRDVLAGLLGYGVS